MPSWTFSHFIVDIQAILCVTTCGFKDLPANEDFWITEPRSANRFADQSLGGHRAMNILPPLVGRFLVAVTLMGLGVTCIVLGYEFAHGGEAYGVGLVVVGVVPLLFGPVYFWRGWRLGAEIRNDALVVRGYFRRQDTVLPLCELLWVHRGASDDATVLEFAGRQFILDDSYFPDSEARDALVCSLRPYAKTDKSA
jgi:hypothetical protein